MDQGGVVGVITQSGGYRSWWISWIGRTRVGYRSWSIRRLIMVYATRASIAGDQLLDRSILINRLMDHQV